MRLEPLFAAIVLFGLAWYDAAFNLINPIPAGDSSLCFTVPALFGYCVPAAFYFFFRWWIVAFYIILGLLFLTRRWGETPA